MISMLVQLSKRYFTSLQHEMLPDILLYCPISGKDTEITHKGGFLIISQTRICGQAFTQHSLYALIHSGKHMLCAVESPSYHFMNKQELKKKKKYTAEIEGAMVKKRKRKRQLESWFNCIKNFCGHPFPSIK